MNNSFYLPNFCSNKNKAIIVGLFFSILAIVPAFAQPATGATDPTCPSGDVISMFSNVYTDVAVDTWLTPWSSATLTDVQVAGNDTKFYENVDFLGIETVGPNLIDASAMTTLNMDIWSADMTTFRIKLVDFGVDGAFGGGDDSEHEIPFSGFALNEWVTLEIPLADFTGLASTANLAQMILSALPTGTGSVYVDNVFYSICETVVEPPSAPTVAAPAPTCPSVDVISMFSEAYTDVPVDTWLTAWSSATNGAITPVAGDETRLYENVDFFGIEMATNQIDASGMTNFNIDIWTPNMTTFRVKLVDFGPGGNSEHEIVFTPTLSGWNTFTIPMADFTGLTGTANIGQLILSGQPVGAGTLYIDNVYFSGTCGAPPATEPTVAAPTPECATGDQISMFSDAFTDVIVDTWLTGWSGATGGGIVPVAGNDTRLYENVDFLGIETVSNPIDASAMTHFNIDVWTPNMTTFRVKLVDFDAGGTTEGEIAFTPTLSGWNTFSIPMVDFYNPALTSGPVLANSSTISQLILSGAPAGTGTLYIDNVYFSGECAFPTEPTVAAPTPECASGDQISMFSEAFTNVPVDTWLTGWSNSTNGAIVPIAGNETRLYENVDFLGIETVSNPIDASAMTHFNIDVWTPNMTTFRVKLVDFDAGGTTEGEIAFTPTLSGWNTFAIPMADFYNPALTSGPVLANSSTISQLILSGLPTGQGKLYIDNVYFSGDCTAAPTCAAPINVAVEVTAPTSALFTWDAVPGATLYQVKYRERGTSVWSKFGTAITQRNLTGLSGNKNYQYKIRAQCADGGWSDYSEAAFFSSFYTSNCEAPTGVATIALDNTSFKVRWDAALEVRGKIRYREVGTIPWLTKNSQLEINYIYVTGLTADADYEYRVRLNCNDDEWSAYNTLYFHSLNALGRASQELTGVNVYPNPVSDVLNIAYDNELGAEATVEVFDILGRAIISERSNDNQIVLNVNQLTRGSYVVSIMVDGKQSIQKFVKR